MMVMSCGAQAGQTNSLATFLADSAVVKGSVLTRASGCCLQIPRVTSASDAVCRTCVSLGQGRSFELCSQLPHVPPQPWLPWHGQHQPAAGARAELSGQRTPAVRLYLQLKPCTLSQSQAGVVLYSLVLQRLAITLGSTQRCDAAAPNCFFLSKRERKSISAESRLGLCLKPLSEEPCLNVIAPLLLQGENILYCSLFLGKLS